MPGLAAVKTVGSVTGMVCSEQSRGQGGHTSLASPPPSQLSDKSGGQRFQLRCVENALPLMIPPPPIPTRWSILVTFITELINSV